MWTTEYDKTGGYDCMTGAYWIRYHGQPVFAIDLSEFGQRHCDYAAFEPRQKAERLARAIVAALNAAGVTRDE